MLENISPVQWWFIAAIVLFIAELLTPGFVVACFGVAALAAVVPALLGLGLVWQVLVFAIASILSLVLLRPFIKRIFPDRKKNASTGMDALIGRRAVVSDELQESEGLVEVAIDGDVWRAKHKAEATLRKGQSVLVVGHESIVLWVEAID